MGRGALLGWMGVGLLLCACSRAPDTVPPTVPPNEAPPGQEVPAPTPPVEPPVERPPTDSGGSDGGTAVDGGDVVQAPPPESFPSVACGPAQPEPLGEVATGTLFAASPGARVLVFEGREEGMRALHVPSGRLTRFASRWWLGITPDERAVVFLGQSGLVELDVATGGTRELLSTPNLYVPQESSLPGFVLLHASNTGGAWAYSWRTGQVLNLVSGAPGGCGAGDEPIANGKILAQDSGAFVLLDAASGERWTTPPATTARLLSDGTGMLYTDAQERVWGWTPDKAPVLLGRYLLELSRPCRPDFSVQQASRTGDVLFVGGYGEATLWNPRTGAVRTLGTDVVKGVLSESGTQLALLHRTPADSWAITVQSLPSGPERVLHRSEGRSGDAFLRLNREGTRLAFSQRVPGDEHKSPTEQRYQVRLWELETDRELILSPTPEPLLYWAHDFSFIEDSELLFLSNQALGAAVYSARTGTGLFAMARWVRPGARNFSFWSDDGVFYARAYDPSGPFHGRMHAWNPRTGVEASIGREMSMACDLGERSLLLMGVLYPDEQSTPGTLLVWTPETGRSQTVATQVMHPRCVPGRRAATFSTDWREATFEEGTYTPRRATLHFMDVERACQQPLATEVEGSLPVDGGMVFLARGKAWRVRLP